MSAAVVLTKSGGAFRLTDAFMIGMEHIGHGRKGNSFEIYAIQEGDNITFVPDTMAIRHTYPNGGHVGHGFITSSNSAKPAPAKFTPTDAQAAAQRMRKANPGHTFDVVPYPA